jgi:hypothetical protein
MWFFGYVVFLLAFALGMHWAACVQRRYRRGAAMALVALLALPVAWTGQVLLIPVSHDGRVRSTDLLPHLVLAGYSVVAGVASASWLAKARISRRAPYLAWFALAHAVLIFGAGLLAVGLSGS